jgi:hypothetical protein
MIHPPLADEIREQAQSQGLAIEEFLQATIRRERSLADQRKIEREQAWWLGLPLSERAKYEGEYVAVHSRQLVDHDRDSGALHQRIGSQYGRTAVLIMPAEGPRELRFVSVRLERE